jgi:CHAT domain-containing protein/tetratricopeptide (TPR) repeat protein
MVKPFACSGLWGMALLGLAIIPGIRGRDWGSHSAPGSSAMPGTPAVPRVSGVATAVDLPAYQEIRDLLRDGRYSDAESGARALLATVERQDGERSLEVARILDLLSEAMRRGGKPAEAETRAAARRAVNIKEELLGPDHPEVAASLHQLASAYFVAGELAEARPLLERSLAIRERALGPNDPLVAESADYLGNLLSEQGEDEAAAPLIERGLRIRERVLEPDDPQIAWSLNGLGKLRRKQGDYAEAHALFERTLSIRERTLGPAHPDLAAPLNNLALLARESGDYPGARDLAERALSVRERALGPDHPVVGDSLDQVGDILRVMGDRAAARQRFERALVIRERTLGPESSGVAYSLDQLARLRAETDEFDAATRLANRSLAIREKAFGPDDSEVSLSLDTLGEVLYLKHAYGAAKPVFERALALREAHLAADHPDLVLDLRMLGVLDERAGDATAAVRLQERALRIEERAFGPNHPDVALILKNLALAFDRSGRDTEALEATLRAETIGREHLRLTGRRLPESQALAYAAVRNSGLDLALSIAARGRKDRPMLAGRAWDALVRSRALVLDEMAARNRALGQADDPETARLAEAVRMARTRLANLQVRGPSGESPERHRARLDQARAESERAESLLAAKSAIAAGELAHGRIGLDQVRAALPAGSGLVAFARYDALLDEASAVEAAGDRPADAFAYLAFVQRADRGTPTIVSLGQASVIEAAVAAWREEAAHGVLKPGRTERQAENANRSAGRALRAAVWDPVARHLAGLDLVFVVPDGALGLVNFAALPAGETQYLADAKPLLHNLSVERDLVAPSRRRSPMRELLVLGDPAFNASPHDAAAEGTTAQGESTRTFRGAAPACAGFASVRFPPLAGTAQEVESIAGVWNRRVGPGIVRLTEAGAGETAFKAQAPGKSVLHLATHGFFLGDECGTAAPGQRGIGRIAVTGAPPEDPLALSGLALAGANHRDTTGEGEDDGILTAEEIAALDLTSVEWAVLSACDTGLGEVRASEGILGLRRAFEVAGARSVFMSLWSVDDQATREWMESLYQGRLELGLGAAEAAGRASREVLNHRRAGGASTHPFYWAAFIASGDWR